MEIFRPSEKGRKINGKAVCFSALNETHFWRSVAHQIFNFNFVKLECDVFDERKNGLLRAVWAKPSKDDANH